jgi:hypothetical protein
VTSVIAKAAPGAPRCDECGWECRDGRRPDRRSVGRAAGGSGRRASAPLLGLAAALQRLVYSALAETFLAGGRIDFAARFCWLLDLLDPRAITGGANNFDKDLTRLFHNDQSLKQNTNLNSFVGR